MAHPVNMTQQQHYYPHANNPTAAPWSGLAIAGFVTSLVWGFGFLSPIGLVLSVLALRDTQRNRKRGFGLAVAGTVLGVLGTIGLAVFIGTGIQTWTT